MILFILAFSLFAKEVDTNAARFADAPDWLTRNRAEKVIDRIQTKLEWTIRKIDVKFYDDAAAFQKAHSLGPLAMAVTRKDTNTIHLGPQVNDKNFDPVFGHELVHVILGQKYKDAVPKWLEEGLANHLAKYDKVDYAWLKKRKLPEDVRNLSHPYQARSVTGVHLHYVASQALAEMLAKKCDLENLLRLSVGEKLENYLATYCEIPDLNASFRKWVASH